MKKNSYLVQLGSTIRKLRKEKGFTQESFADHIELDRAYFGSIERGERNISAVNLIKIAKGLELQVGDFFPFIKFNLKEKRSTRSN